MTKEDLNGGWVDGDDVVHRVTDERDTFPSLGELPVRGEAPQCGDTKLNPGRIVAMVNRATREYQCELEPTVAFDAPHDPRWRELPVRGEDAPRPEFVTNGEAWTPGPRGARRHVWHARRFAELTDAEVKEVMAYDLTPRALQALRSAGPTVKEVGTLKPSDLLLMNALAGDGPVEQLRPPPVPEVTSPSFKLGVFCGLLVGSGVMAALPYIVELLK